MDKENALFVTAMEISEKENKPVIKNIKSLEQKALELAQWIQSNNDFLIVSQNDCDAITATAIVLKALEREGKNFDRIALKQLYESSIPEIQRALKEKKMKKMIFLDLGSGQMHHLKKSFEQSDFIVLDHHQQVEVGENVNELNPFMHGVDGGSEISSSGLATEYFNCLVTLN